MRWFLRFTAVGLLMFAVAMLVSVGWAQTFRPPDHEMLFIPSCCQDRLYRFSIDRGVRVNLTVNRSELNREPVWSPDGTQIAYAAFCESGWTLMVMDASRKNIRQIGACVPYLLSQLRWSPDRTRIAAIGREFTFTTFYHALIFDLGTEQYTSVLSHARNLAASGWSVDGSEALFTNLSSGSTEWRINVENGAIYSQPSDGLSYEQHWSPNRQYIAASVPVPNPFRIVLQIRDAMLDELIAELEPNPQNYVPVWSPDGQRIAFISSGNNRPQSISLYVVDADGENLRLLVEIPLNSREPGFFAPQWTPDSQVIVFGNSTQLTVVDAQTGVVLAQQPYFFYATVRP